MNAVLAEIYSTVIPSAPYVIAAYVLVFLALFAYTFYAFSKVRRAEKQMDALEEHVQELLEKQQR